MDVKYIDDKVILQCINGEKIVEKFVAYPKEGTSVKRYFGVPLSYAKRNINADFENSIKINENHVDVYYNKPFVEKSFNFGFGGSRKKALHFPIPITIYKTDKHIVITPNKVQLSMSKIVFGIEVTVISFLLLILLAVSFVSTPIIFIAFAIFFSPVLIYSYLFFIKKSYILVGPLESMDSINKNTIRIKGQFDTGIKSCLAESYDMEFYIGEK